MSYKKQNKYTVTLSVAKNIQAETREEAVRKAIDEIKDCTYFDVDDVLDVELRDYDMTEDADWGVERDEGSDY